MYVGWCVLLLGTVFGNELFHAVGSLLVHLVKLWPVSPDSKVGIDVVVRLQEFGPVSRPNGVRRDVVAVCADKDEYHTVTPI